MRFLAGLIAVLATTAVAGLSVRAHGQTSASHGTPAGSCPHSPRDTIVLRAAAEIEQRRPSMQAMWPGAWADSVDYMLYPFCGGGLVVTSHQRSGLSRLEPPSDDSLLGSVRRRLFFSTTAPKVWPGMSLRFSVSSAPIPAFSLLDSLTNIRAQLPATVSFVFHELFHLFQERGFANSWGLERYRPWDEPSVDRGVVLDSEFTVGLRAERERLAEAVDAYPSEVQVRAKARDFLCLRRRRLARREVVDSFEQHTERKEGTALFLGWKAAVGRDGRTSSMQELLSVGLRSGIAGGIPADPWTSYRDWHLYVSGAAEVFLLEFLAPGWAGRVQRGETPLGVLEGAIGGCHVGTPSS